MRDRSEYSYRIMGGGTVRTNKAELHRPRPFGFDAPAQAKAGIGRSWTETGGAKPGFHPTVTVDLWDLAYSRQLKLPKWRFTPINMGGGRDWTPHPLGEAKILGKKKVWCFFFV